MNKTIAGNFRIGLVPTADNPRTIFLGQPKVGYTWELQNWMARLERNGDWAAEVLIEIAVAGRVISSFNEVPDPGKAVRSVWTFAGVFAQSVVVHSGQDVTVTITIQDNLATVWNYRAEIQLNEKGKLA